MPFIIAQQLACLRLRLEAAFTATVSATTVPLSHLQQGALQTMCNIFSIEAHSDANLGTGCAPVQPVPPHSGAGAVLNDVLKPSRTT